MRIIYNEGRVVGLSAYELYVRELLSEDPDADVPTEQEWVTRINQGGDGSSMILRIPNNTPAGYIDFTLPQDSQLIGCGTLRAYLFDGTCEWDNNTWAKSVTDYGTLINPSATQSSMPAPKSNPQQYSATFKKQASNYLKINSGIYFQPGTWTSLTSDYVPDLSQPGKVRFAINEKLTNDVYIIISGFRKKQWVKDAVPSSQQTEQQAKDGAFLGPECFPWASKIIMVVSSDIVKATEEYYTMTLSEYNALTSKENHFYYCTEG